MSEAVRRESAPELLWKPYSVNENGKSSNSRMLMPSNKDNCFQKSEDTLDINGNYHDKFCDSDEKFSDEDKENLNRLVCSGNFGGHDGDLCKERCDYNGRNGEGKSSIESVVEQRRNSTSDLYFKASDFINANSISLRRSSILEGGVKSMEKMDKINLANLVFNPNFKNSAGCVNLPVIRAGQNMTQKNAQRFSLAAVKDSLKEDGGLSPKEFSQKTHQAALELLSRQLQPQSLDAFSQKMQQLSVQRKSKASGNSDTEDQTTASSSRGLGCSEEIIQTFTGKPQLSQQQQQQQQQQPHGNGLRYKTELCRSDVESGECRFGSACTFAHGAEELRPVPRHPLYKTELCRTYHQHGYCQYGTRCHFIHDADEADKNAPLEGCKSWGRHDQLSGAMLSRNSSGLRDSGGAAQQTASSSDNDVLLSNLRRLYALRVMNGHEKTADQSTQFSMSQPMGHQLSMAHQKLASAGFSGVGHLPLSMTQPLPMDALHMGLQSVGQLHHYHQRVSGQLCPRFTSNSRLESMASDYCGWGVAPPPPPANSGVSPFGSYHQQFSPLPLHQTSSSGYPSQPYSFSATAPDLTAALNMVSPYSMSPQFFSNTVNVGHYLQDPSANYAAAASVSANYHKTAAYSTNSQGASSGVGQRVYVGALNPGWPQTSSEASGAVEHELFRLDKNSRSSSGLSKSGDGCASGNPIPPHQQYRDPHIHSMPAYQQQQPHQHQTHDWSKMAYAEQFKYPYQSGDSGPNERTSEPDLLSLLQGGYCDKYGNGRESKTLGSINEFIDGGDQSVRPKTRTRTSVGNLMLN